MKQLAIIGCGRHMQNTLSRYLCQFHDVQFTDCVDIDPVAAEKVRGMLNARRCLENPKEIHFHDTDAVIIAVPPQAAYEFAGFFISHKIPCFIEKPPAPTTNKISELQTLAEENHTFVQVGFNFRFSTAIATIESIIEGNNDEVQVMLVDFLSKYPMGPEWGVGNMVEAWVRHNGIHALDLVCSLLGDAQSVATQLIPVNDRFLLVIQSSHKNNKVAICRLGNFTGQFELRVEAWTAAGKKIYMPHLGEVSIRNSADNFIESIAYRPKNLDTGWGRAGYGSELDHFVYHFSLEMNTTPSLQDAVVASQFADLILSTENTRVII